MTSYSLLTISQRLAAIEQQLELMRRDITALRNTASATSDASEQARTQTCRAIAELAGRFDELQECAMPTFFKVFPRQGEFLDEVDFIVRNQNSRRG